MDNENIEVLSSCAVCPFKNIDRICKIEDKERARHPDTCPTINETDTLEKSLAEYMKDPEIHEFALNAARQEKSCYIEGPNPRGPGAQPFKPRVQETAEFCVRMGYKRVGLAFCNVVHPEAAKLQKILEAYGLEVVSAVCKYGGVPKETIGVKPEEKIVPTRYETMCNPIGQALLMNEAKTEFNIILGLCVGHDSLFIKYSDAMCTVLASKDRVLGHNAMAALYAQNYTDYLLKGGK